MAKKTQTPAVQRISFKELCELPEVKERFRELLGDKNGIAFLDSAVRLVQKNPELMKCEPESVLNAAAGIASLNLMVDPSFGQAFIVAYKHKDGFIWKDLAQFQIGYKGLIELGHRSGNFETVNSSDVREGEFLKQDRMTGELEFDWKDQDQRKKLPIIGFVAYFKTSTGFKKGMYMTIEEMKLHGKTYSKKFKEKDGQWETNFEGMGCKTVLKLLLDKYAPKSREMKRAIEFDQAIIGDIHGQSLNYIDNPNTKVKVDLEQNNKAVERQRQIDHIAASKSISKLEQVYEHILDQEIRELYDAKLKTLVK